MKKVLAFAAVFVGGVLVGALGMNVLHMRVRPTYRDMLRASFRVEQELSASREARQGSSLRSVVHRWNVADSSSSTGFRIFRPEWNAAQDQDFWFPFRLLVLKRIVSAADPSGRGGELDESLCRAKLALALESLQENREAEVQWELAARLQGRDRDAARKLAEESIKSENSDVQRQAEDAVLNGRGQSKP